MPFRDIAHHHRIFIGFFLYSLTLGAIYPRLGDLQLQMGVREGALGLGLLGAALGTQVSLMLLGHLAERFGHARTVIGAVPVLGLAQIAATFAPGIGAFFLCLFASGLAIGLIEIVLNLEADRAEHQLGRRVMSRAHAFWSFGFFASGMIGAGMAQLGVSPVLHLVMVDGLAAVALYLLFSGFAEAPARHSDQGDRPRFVMPTIGILALVAYTLSAMVLEGAGADWSVIFMRDTFDVTPFVNGLAFALGACAQGIVRFFGDRFVDRFGPLAVARFLVVLLGIGCAMVTFAPWPMLALAGFALAGVGTALAFPLAMSAAAQRSDRAAVANVAAFAQMSFVVFLFAPPLLGFVAQHFGIRWSFGIALPLVVLSYAFTKYLVPKAMPRA